MHDIHASTAGALPELLAKLKEKGYRIVHMRAKTPVQTIAEFQLPVKAAANEARPRIRVASRLVRRQRMTGLRTR